jgi:hypothetical protein
MSKASFNQIRLETSAYGLYFNTSSVLGNYPNALLFSRIDIIDNTEAGIYSSPPTTKGLQAIFQQCMIESNHKSGAYFYNTNNFEINQCLFEANNKDVAGNKDDLFISFPTQRDAFISIIDSTFIGTDVTYSLYMDSSNNFKIERTYFNDVVTLDYCRYGEVVANKFIGATTFTADVKNTLFWGNSGYATENSGTFSIALHSTTATVTHGLSYTPTAADIGITWTTVGGLLNCTSWSVTGIGANTFTVNLYDANGAAKGPSGTVTGSWKSIKTP